MLTGCKNNIQTMLDDYNSSFSILPEKPLPSPGDIDFVASEMLYSEYYVASDDTLNISGPYNCNSYLWVVTKPDSTTDKDEVVNINLYDSYTLNEREFVTYIPDSGLEVGKTYRLTLTVTDKEGNEYKDSCGLVIYKHYDFNQETLEQEAKRLEAERKRFEEMAEKEKEKAEKEKSEAENPEEKDSGADPPAETTPDKKTEVPQTEE
jgi:hypothetical protein